MHLAVAVLAAWTAATFPEVPDERWSIDQAEVLSEADEARIEQRVDQLHGATGMEVAVVTADAVEGTPRQFSIDLFNRWGVGDSAHNDGWLFLLVVDERRLEVRTGRGIEGRFPDDWVARMQQESMVPAFKDGRYADGLVAGLDRVETRWQELGAKAEAPSQSLTEVRATPGLEEETAQGMEFLAGLVLAAFGLVGLVFWSDRQGRCPRCRKGHLHHSKRVLEEATTESAGRIEMQESCDRCDYCLKTEKAVAPRQVVTDGDYEDAYDPTDYMGGFGGGGGGWGGGSTGGGGAGSDW